jgi:hypothetical protein
MSEYSAIKKSLLNKLHNVDLKDKEETESIINALKVISEAEKSSYEAEKTQKDLRHYEKDQKRELNKFFIGVIAPLVSAFALVFTLGFQFYQSNQNTRLQLEGAEATEWRALLGKLDSIKNSDLTIPTTLKSFFDSKRYGKPSREMTSLLLPRVASEKVFQIIFPEFMKRTDWSNFKDLKNLFEGLNEMYDEDQSVIKRDSAAIKSFLIRYKAGFIQKFRAMNGTDPDSSSLAEIEPPVEVAKSLDAENHYSDERLKEIKDVGQAIADFLRKNQKDPSGNPLDLSNCFFSTVDLSGIDLTKANLQDTWFVSCDVKDCILDSLQFGTSYWVSTAWWRAKRMDSTTFETLNQSVPYNSSIAYYTKGPAEDDSLSYLNFTKRFKAR